MSLLARLVAAGTPADLVGEVALLIAKAQLLEERKANDRERKERQRANPMSREVTGQPGHDVTSASRAGATRAEPETTLSEENISKEERKIPPPAEPTARKHLLPDDFVPSDATMARGRELGFTLPEINDRLASMREWSLGKGEKRLDWNLVFQGFLRRDAERRATTGPPGRAGNGTGFNGKPTLGDIRNAAKAAIAARDANGRPNLELLAGPDRRARTGDGDHGPPDGVSRSADRPDGDRGGVLRGFQRVGAWTG